MVLCIVNKCKNDSRYKLKGISYFMCPQSNTDLKSVWIKKLNISNTKIKRHSRICSLHFEDKFKRKCAKNTILEKWAVPTIFEDSVKQGNTNKKGKIKSTSKLHQKPTSTLIVKEGAVALGDDANVIPQDHKSNSCLICLKTDAITLIYTTFASEVSLADKIKSFADVTISEKNDGFLCADCVVKIHDCYKFKKQCENSFKIFKNMHTVKKKSATENIEMNEPISVLNKSQIEPEILHFKPSEQIVNDQFCSVFLSEDNFFEQEIFNTCLDIKEEPNDLDLIIPQEEIKREIIDVINMDDVLLINDNPARNSTRNECTKKIELDEDLLKQKVYAANEVEKFYESNNNKTKERKTSVDKQENKFKCKICNRQYKTSQSLELHIQNHEHIKYKCDKCEKVFSRNSSLLEHEILHTNETPYECDKCPKKFQQKVKLISHKRWHKTSKFMCEICSSQFISIQSLNHHKLFHEPPKYKCNECEKLFHTSVGLRIHEKRHEGIIRHHCDECGKTLSTNNALIMHKKAVHLGIKRYKCVICNKEFFNSYNYHLHIRRHTGERPFECNLCEFKFVNSNLLKLHLEKKHSIKSTVRKNIIQRCEQRKPKQNGQKSFQCPVCNKTLRNSLTLSNHMKIHTGKGRLQCEVCNKTLSNSSTLKNHMRMHTGDTRYECHICKKILVSSHSLIGHSRIHTGEKPYKCGFCPETFVFISARIIHERKHTGVKHQVCGVCQKVLNSPAHLRVHMRKHTGEKPYKCHLCEKRFSTNGYLTVHLRIHKGEQRFPCNQCDAKYDRLSHLKSHIEQHEKKENVVHSNENILRNIQKIIPDSSSFLN